MTRAALAILLLLAGCAPAPVDDGPLTPLREHRANPLLMQPAQDPNGGAS